MDRLWGISLLFGLVLFALWWFGRGFTLFFRSEIELLIQVSAVFVTTVAIFAFFARRMGYVRAYSDYLLIATPFFRFKTSYRRVHEVRTIEYHNLLKTEKLSWTENSYLKPFLGETSVVVRLRAFPLSPVLLKLMLPKQMIDSETTSLILLVSDWMALSLEIDSRYNIWRQITRRKQTRFGFQRGQYN